MNVLVYSKLIAAVVGMAAAYFGPEYIPAPEALTEAIILALTAFGVWAAPNVGPDPDLVDVVDDGWTVG